MSFTCGSIHQSHEWFSDDSRGRQEIFMWAILPIISRMEVPRSSPSWWDHFIPRRVFSSREVLGKNASIVSKLPTADCWSRKEKKGRCFMLYVESNFSTTDKSLTVFFTCWGIEFDHQVKISVHCFKLFDHWITCPVQAKVKLASYCSIDFDFLA